MYLAVSSAQGSVDSMTALDAALVTPTISPGVGLGGYVTDSQRKRIMTFYPPPYGFAAGMGCAGNNCSCGGSCGMGQVDFSNLFASGTDISGWGWPEWGLVGLGAFAVGSAVSNVANAGRKVGRSIKRARRRMAS